MKMSPWILIGNLMSRSPFSFSKKRSSVCAIESRRDELRRVASKSASDIQKKDNAAYAAANFTFIDG